MSIRVTPVAHDFVAEIAGIDLARPLSAADRDAIQAAIDRYAVVVFHDQNELLAAFKRGELEKDFVAVIRFQGPRANGMPELHKLTPVLGALQDQGYRVALVTDGRMSGASGKVPAAMELLGTPRKTLYDKLHRHGIQLDSFR